MMLYKVFKNPCTRLSLNNEYATAAGKRARLVTVATGENLCASAHREETKRDVKMSLSGRRLVSDWSVINALLMRQTNILLALAFRYCRYMTETITEPVRSGGRGEITTP